MHRCYRTMVGKHLLGEAQEEHYFVYRVNPADPLKLCKGPAPIDFAEIEWV